MAQLGSPPPSVDEVPLDPTTIPQFVTQLPIPRTYAPTIVRDSSGKVIRAEYTITDSRIQVQMLPTGFPPTTVLAMGGQTFVPGSFQTQFFQSTPGSVFENIRGIPTVVHWQTNIQQPHFLAVDPTIHFSNPNAMERPLPPFQNFPPGYPQALFPIAHVTHTHGLMVLPQDDGTAEEWFTPGNQVRGPSFVTSDYTMPNDQPSTQLFYHDHVMGVTRIGLYSGEVGAGYIIRDPNSPLDALRSPLPKGKYEIPLAIVSRQFFTDGNLSFPPDPGSTNAGADAPPQIAYWSYNEGADTVLVNGAVWPNLNVDRHQYRFRTLAGANTQLWDLQLVNQTDGSIVPITIIGSDGGYLPAPQVVNDVQIGITERADILVDFSPFPAGTKIQMNNLYVGSGSSPTLGQVMQFTVQNTPAVPPPALDPALFPKRAVLTPDAPKRTKVLRVWDDLRPDGDTCSDPALPECNERSIDGLEFTTPATEFPLVGSTEEWDIVHLMDPRQDDQDKNFHQIHIHLLEFQILNRQPIDADAYRTQWHILNGHKPVSRPIVIDPTPYFTGPSQPPAPYETGWKDTVQAVPAMVTRMLVRWAPQESTSSTPGVNQFSIDPTSFPDNVKGPGYVWHCHIVGHEDHDMMRPLGVVNSWAPGVRYQPGNVVEFQKVDYRVRQTHTSQVDWSPPAVPALFSRANNNDGTWQPQIVYAVGDRVLFQGKLYAARLVHQSQVGWEPTAQPTLWSPLPMTACTQLAQFCQGNSNPNAAQCLADGQTGNETICGAEIEPCLSYCQPAQATPCSGLCNNPIRFSVADGSSFSSGNLGAGDSCFETVSQLASGSDAGFAPGRTLQVNGRFQNLNANWRVPLPPERNDGYCVQVSGGNNTNASFTVK